MWNRILICRTSKSRIEQVEALAGLLAGDILLGAYSFQSTTSKMLCIPQQCLSSPWHHRILLPLLRFCDA